MDNKEFKLIAKTFQGLEDVLAEELTSLGANNIEKGNRMVSFTGDKEMMYRANFCLRTAIRILKPIREFKATDAEDLYDEVKKIEWEEYMDNKTTFKIDTVVFSDEFHHSKFVAYKVKDGIADYFREKTGNRPNVVLTNPMLIINVHISGDFVTISLDSSGESLHKRGYREGTVDAPLNEVLAAGMIMLAGWDGQCDLIDPMCGSGTILVEAALIARNVWPGVFRKEYAFEKWKDFNPSMLDAIYNDDSQEREFSHKIYGYDINRQCVAISQANVKSAGMTDVVEVAQRDMADFVRPAEKAIMITNPPYGERITTDNLLEFYGLIGQKLKHEFSNNDAWIISYREECFDKIGMRPSTKYALFNGALECEYRHYQIFDGRLSDRRNEGMDIKSDEEREHNKTYKPHRHEEAKDDGREVTGFNRDRKPFEKKKKVYEPFMSLIQTRPEDREDSDRRRSGFGDKRRGDERRPFGDKFDRHKSNRSFDNKREPRKPFKEDGKRPSGKGRERKWGFDSEGRPFRKKDED